MTAYITVGATTTHGGEVITGSTHSTHNGIPISRKGDKVICKKCKKLTTILTGDPSFIVDGAPIARAGDVTSCGAKLIAIQPSFLKSNFEVMGIGEVMSDEAIHNNLINESNKIKDKCEIYPNICHRRDKADRFLGEAIAMQYLLDHDDDANLAWRAIRDHRLTYKGLREADRNAEHYLYALDDVRSSQYNAKYTPYYLLSPGYSMYKAAHNSWGNVVEAVTGSNPSDYKGSPPSIDEVEAGLSGADDAVYGIRKN